jgi:hypothetical protein
MNARPKVIRVLQPPKWSPPLPNPQNGSVQVPTCFPVAPPLLRPNGHHPFQLFPAGREHRPPPHHRFAISSELLTPFSLFFEWLHGITHLSNLFIPSLGGWFAYFLCCRPPPPPGHCRRPYPDPLFAFFLKVGLQDNSVKLPSQAKEHLIHLLDLTLSMTIASPPPLTVDPLLVASPVEDPFFVLPVSPSSFRTKPLWERRSERHSGGHRTSFSDRCVPASHLVGQRRSARPTGTASWLGHGPDRTWHMLDLVWSSPCAPRYCRDLIGRFKFQKFKSWFKS